ncbi:MAG: hypothetical protein GYB64_19850 [Chloroflexi bacterium]|nr:hypothetical protein [Chloroflexota bacterium]
MPQFVAIDPAVEVNGRTILATIAGVGPLATQLFTDRGIETIDPQGWYSQQMWLDVLKELTDRGIAMQLAGMSIPQNADFPPDIDGIHAALASIDVAYRMNHRGGEIGSYQYEKIGPTHARLICDNPYPSDFDYGIIYQMATVFSPPGTSITVERAPAPSRLNGDDTCIYDVMW